jgi:hypothetical protein
MAKLKTPEIEDINDITVDDMDERFGNNSAEVVKQTKLGGFNFSILSDEDSEKSMDELLGKKLDKKRYVVARLVSYPNTKLNYCDITLNGEKAHFTVGQPTIVRHYLVAAAQKSGFVGYSDGVSSRIAKNNTPIFKVEEFPAEIDNMSFAGAKEFKQLVYEKTNIQMVFASSYDN